MSPWSRTSLALIIVAQVSTISAVLVSPSRHFPCRRHVAIGGGAALLFGAGQVSARTPGSTDVSEAVIQIKQGRDALRGLQQDWRTYACIDREGRACNIDVARKILGGVAPQRGEAAIETAKATPLYRIDGAFKAIRRYALDAGADEWGSRLDVEAFVDRSEDIVFALKKTDDSFYGVVFASKGTVQLEGIYKEAKQSVDRCLSDMDAVLAMLKDAKAPGL